MSINLIETQFHKMGLAIDPSDPSRAVPIASLGESMPDETWDLDRLARYASAGLAKADRLMQGSIQIGRRSTVEIFRSGRALSIARRRLKAEGRGRWTRWLEQHGIKRTTAWEAAELFERAGSEDKVANLMPGEAKRLFWVISPPREDEDSAGGGAADRGTQSPSTQSAKPPSKVAVPPAKRGNEGAHGRGGADGRSTGTGTTQGPVPAQADGPAGRLLPSLINVVHVLNYLEDEAGRAEWRGDAQDELLRWIDEGIETYNRIRERVACHAA
ncbi:hypothetical protein BH23PLA1_BH23PLA1_39260 [soil metagenome]